MDLHYVDGHRWNLSYYDSAKRVCYVQLRIGQLKFQLVARRGLQDANCRHVYLLGSLLLHLLLTLLLLLGLVIAASVVAVQKAKSTL